VASTEPETADAGTAEAGAAVSGGAELPTTTSEPTSTSMPAGAGGDASGAAEAEVAESGAALAGSGGTPSLSVGYSSGAVDGMVSSRNTEAGPMGVSKQGSWHPSADASTTSAAPGPARRPPAHAPRGRISRLSPRPGQGPDRPSARPSAPPAPAPPANRSASRHSPRPDCQSSGIPDDTAWHPG
jgi:hypothetical protein